MSSATVFPYPVVAGLDCPRGPGVWGISAPYLARFGLALPGGSSRRCSPRPGLTTSRPTAPGGIGISFGVWSGSMPASKDRRNSISVSAVASTNHYLVISVGLLPAHLLTSLLFLLTSLIWSTTTTFVGSPPPPRKEHPEPRAPKCSGEGNRQPTVVL